MNFILFVNFGITYYKIWFFFKIKNTNNSETVILLISNKCKFRILLKKKLVRNPPHPLKTL